MKTIALIVAAGTSKRFGGEIPKQFEQIAGKPLLVHTIEKFEQTDIIDKIVLVTSEDQMIYTSENIVDKYNFSKILKIVKGGENRTQSVFNGLTSLPESTQYVAIHDGARPLVSVTDIDRVVKTAQIEKAAILAEAATDTVKLSDNDFIEITLDRDKLFLAQTPQVFEYNLILKEYKKMMNEKQADRFTDDASLLEEAEIDVRIVQPTSYNFKITTKRDFDLAEMIIERGLND